MKIIRKAGDTSNILQIFIQDSSSTTGAGLTGLANASAGLTAYYHKDTDTTATAITLVTMTVGTFTSSGFKEIDATNMPGWYQFCPPDAAFSTTGAPKSVGFHLKGATNMAPLAIEVQLVSVDLQDTVRMGLTAMPNVASGSAGAIITSGTGTAQLSVSSGLVTLAASQPGVTIPTVTTVTNQLTAAQIATGVWTDTTAGDFTVASSVGKSVMNGVALGTGLTVNALTTNNDKTGYSLTQAFPTNFSSLGITAGGHITTVDTVTNQLTGAAIATAIWTDTTSTDFTTALSVGKSLMNGVSLGTGLTVNDITTKTGYSLASSQTFNVTGNITGNLSGSVGSVTGAVGSVTGAVGSVTARVTANTDQINGNATSASNVAHTMQAITRGTCSGGTTTTAVCSAITSPATLTASGQLIGRTILFDADTTTAALQGQASNITASTTGTTPTITFTAMTTAPVSGDTFSIV